MVEHKSSRRPFLMSTFDLKVTSISGIGYSIPDVAPKSALDQCCVAKQRSGLR
jgi:hypothetical protein